ncbi:hypothetical protein D9757_005712 [Collybiopsis confluens]|uniref:F-box domain-containing protein n=1 Tax=Collybiopsis confluens TaxID=2823264 RepID=A0A8H5HPN3_9AGAR|nr:hypothetical protein D9757_005712 [Collybiopsis confluens]
MSPHRHRGSRSTVRRFKISNDILLTILEFLDPPSLWRVCKAFTRAYSLMMEYQSLRYKYELAISGMKDGPVTKVPPISRLHLLLTYRKDWLQLGWTHEHRLQIPLPAQVSASVGFIHHVQKHGAYSTIELSELPSSRKNRPPTLTRHLKFTTSIVDRVAVDLGQALIVTGSIFRYHNQIGIQLHFRDLWSFNKHPYARALSYEFSSQVSTSAAVVRMAILVCGSKMAVSLEFAGGRIKHLILNWLNLDARWLDDQDVQFLDETYLLGVATRSGSAVVNLYNVSKVPSITVVREFELPEIWANTTMKFVPNSSPKSDLSQSSDALFYAAPETRVLALTSTPVVISRSEYYPMNWLFLKESYFRFPSRRDGFRVSWRQWGQYCLIKEIHVPSKLVCGPYVVGTKVFYVENSPRSHGHSRLHVIDFSPFPESTASSEGWASAGPRAGLVPNENGRSIPSSSVDGLAVKDITATEDNIVLFLEAHQGYQSVNVLTFGVPMGGSSRRHR